MQGVPEAKYRERIVEILATLRGILPANRILVVTTPDYTVTPAGADYGDPATMRAGIRRVNAIATEEARRLGVAVVDIFDISAGAATDRGLVARDGLHPSGASTACGWSGSRPWRARSSRSPRRSSGARGPRGSVAMQLQQSGVVDPEVMGDLVVERLHDRPLEPGGVGIRPRQWPAEQRDPARQGALSAAQRVRGTPSYRP